jgi:tight adherence protein B
MIVLAAGALSAAALMLSSSPRRRLIRTDRKTLPPHVVPLILVCSLAAGVVLLPLTTVLGIVVVAATMSLRYRRRRRGDRAMRESRSMESAIEVLVGELRIGAHPATAFAAAAEETAGPVGASCRAVAARARLGADVAAGLRGVAKTSALASQWERLAVCWQLATDHGLAMSALMHAAQRDIAERQRFSGQVRSAMAGARATATILAALPVLSVVMGQLVGARPLPFLLGGGLGGWLLVVGLSLICAGLLWADRITDRATT